MSRKSRGFQKPAAGGAKHWVMLEHYLLACPAWCDLSANARVVYVELKRRYNGKNNGMLRLSTREAAAIIKAEASNDTGARALTELTDHGFIAVTEDSTFNRKVHVARSYLLTEAASDVLVAVGEKRLMATKDFLRWTPEQMHDSVRSIGHHSTTHRTREAESA